jgi:hypothetical protein
MKKQELRRIGKFALYGAIGFGIGGGVAGGLFMDIGYYSDWFLLGFIAFGAIGGLALGLALKDWVRAILLVFFGAIATLIGFVLGRIIFGPVDFAYSYVEITIIWGMIGGAIGGTAVGLVSAGLSFWILTLAGAIGFGIGMVIATPVDHWYKWALVGIIGGAFLGAALGYLEKRKTKSHS